MLGAGLEYKTRAYAHAIINNAILHKNVAICYCLLFGFVRSPPMSSAFQTSSGTTLAHCGTADTGRENPDIACLIACTWAAVEKVGRNYLCMIC